MIAVCVDVPAEGPITWGVMVVKVVGADFAGLYHGRSINWAVMARMTTIGAVVRGNLVILTFWQTNMEMENQVFFPRKHEENLENQF